MTTDESASTERFEKLFAAHVTEISAYCQWRSRSPHDAEDSLAEVFLTAWRRLDQIPDDQAAARVWLYAAARRVTANSLRSARRRAGLLDRLFSLSPAEEFGSIYSQRPDAHAVHEALRTLKRRDQEVLLLAEWEQLSSAEIASVMGCSESSARGRLHRARKRFRQAYERLCPQVVNQSACDTEANPLHQHRSLSLAEDVDQLPA